MDMTWVTDRVAVGGGIWTNNNMKQVVAAGITHIIDMQIEFDDTELAQPYGIEVLWNAVDDDFQPKPAEIFERGVEFALAALDPKIGGFAKRDRLTVGDVNSRCDLRTSSYHVRVGVARVGGEPLVALT